jgi:ribosomal-protein-alanine acetyltransferase
MIVRDAALRDLDSLVRIEDESFEEDRFSRKILELMITETDFETLVGVVDGTVVAYVTAHTAEGSDKAQILSLAVDEGHQRIGVGREMMRQIERRIDHHRTRTITLEVRLTNIPAIDLYLSEGYSVKGLIHGYYGDGEDAIYMEKDLAT